MELGKPRGESTEEKSADSKELQRVGDSEMKRLVITFLSIMLVVVAVSEMNAQSRSGTYYRSDEYGRGTVTFKDLGSAKSRRLSFYVLISGAQRGTCMGEHRGTAKWLSSSVAEYDSSAAGCRLTFMFSGRRVMVRETNCDDSHGVVCQFEGTYVLKRK